MKRAYKTLVALPALCLVLIAWSAGVAAQPDTLPDGATSVPPEMGVVPPLSAASAPLDLKPRMRPGLLLKPRMKSEELKPARRPGMTPEMSPGMQPNSQKPLRHDKDALPAQ